MSNFLRIDLKLRSAQELDIVTAILADNDFYAFEQEDNTLKAYILEDDFNETKLSNLLPHPTSYTVECIAERNWNEQWEQQMQPVRIHHFAGVRTAFQQPLQDVLHEIIITPKMSFGTGHHASTCIAMELMEQISFEGKSVIDFGTGTAILAILAEKLGASPILAIDHDEWSILNANENIQENRAVHIATEKRNNIKDLEAVDIIIANLNLNIIAEQSLDFASGVKKGGGLLISGFLCSDLAQVLDLFVERDFVKTRESFSGDWAGLFLEKQSCFL